MIARAIALLGALLLTLNPAPLSAETPLRLYAAGSLRAVLTEIGAAFTAAHGTRIEPVFGASGLLKDRLEKGEPADVFASANMEHPQALEKSGKAGPTVVFARNRLCALTRAEVKLTSTTLLSTMLDQNVRLGTSTPKADPSGDYAWMLFERAERIHPGASAALRAKALQLTGGPNSPAPPAGQSIYGKLVAERAADVFLTYCTNAAQAKAEVPSLDIIAVPETLVVGADYGLALLADARREAAFFAMYILSPRGQTILQAHGFTPVGLPDAGGR